MIRSLDHLVLTVADLDATIRFYEALGMEAISFRQGRRALVFGEQKINLHEAGHEFEPKAARPSPGSADLCFLIDGTLDDAMKALAEIGVSVEEGPLARTGAIGPITSIYCRDPDGNLIELSVMAEPS